FYGILRGESWLVVGVDEAADVSMAVSMDGNRCLRPQIFWESEKGTWGYERSLRFLMGNTGGVTAACKAYKKYREPFGFGVSLREKAKRVPQLEQMAGAANVWLWHDDYETLMYGTTTDPIDVENHAAIRQIATEMKVGGMENLLFGIFFQQDMPVVRFLREELGYLVTKYDNYQDVMPHDLQRVIPEHRVKSCDTLDRRSINWPDDILILPNGSLVPCWALYGTDGKKYSQNAMCDRQAEPYIRREIAEEVEKFGFNARFLDVMGIGLRECYSKEHPMTRRECRTYKFRNLDALADLGQIGGTEEGIEPLLPAFHYSEGKMSVFPYRLQPSMCWRYKSKSFFDQPQNEAYLDRYMLNPRYRVPLWELVYHECSVNYGYWGDAANLVPERMPERDLFHLLYGTPPIYSFETQDWPRLKERILASYRRASLTARKTCFEEMLSFNYLTSDKQVQQTQFSDGTVVTVNFSDQTFDGIEPKGFRIDND
ncbi:MAG: glycoside hydrolase, partial [Planctomycetia bacterium]|nr:glycoside hydrolase [Planctomycetia bacterium]